jgi:hypothetical protein
VSFLPNDLMAGTMAGGAGIGNGRAVVAIAQIPNSSFRRRPESIVSTVYPADHWTPAFAGVTTDIFSNFIEGGRAVDIFNDSITF